MTGIDRILDSGLSEAARALATAAFAALWRGQASPPEELMAPAVADRAAPALAELLARGRAEVDDDGRLVGAHGLTLRPTRHRFVHAGRTHHTWCAFDSIGVPAALRIDAEADSSCPACSLPLHVAIRAGAPEPSAAALWLPSATVGHLMAEFCSAADLYCDRAHLESRIDLARAAGEILDLAAAAELGRRAWADVAGVAGAAG